MPWGFGLIPLQPSEPSETSSQDVAVTRGNARGSRTGEALGRGGPEAENSNEFYASVDYRKRRQLPELPEMVRASSPCSAVHACVRMSCQWALPAHARRDNCGTARMAE